jgi:hypothetical protein
MDKLAAATSVGRNAPTPPAIGPADDLPPEYWRSILDDVSADSKPAAYPIQKQRLCDVNRHLLRVGCRRCGRTVEIQTADAVRVAGPQAVWKEIGQRLLDDTCQIRTGSHEDDGCWPLFE